MTVLKIKDKEYKVKFTYNNFCDTDLLERTQMLLGVFKGSRVENDKDVSSFGKIKDLFVCVRELLYVGFMKHNPVDSVQDIGDILDDYQAEGTEEDPRGILNLFILLTEELMNEGFLSSLLRTIPEVKPQEKKVRESKK